MNVKIVSLNTSARKSFKLDKRIFDIAFSLGAMIVLSPLFLLISFLIFLSCPGRVIFAQERIGLKGRPFRCLKFRNMYEDAEEKLSELIENNATLKEEWERKQKLTHDPRVFAFGRFLRKTSLDELPQFWNVLRGDLSLVGPRPYLLSQQKALGHLEKKILSVRPGVTGLWQTSGRSRTTFQERIRLDAEYIDRSSFAFDLHLILKTIPLVLFAKDAY